MKQIIILILFAIQCQVFAQSDFVEWTQDYEITIDNFRAEIPNNDKDEIQEYFLASNLAFEYEMNAVEFALTKNFNKYVRAYFSAEQSYLEDDLMTAQVLEIVNVEFDILELFARKLRKELAENKNYLSSNEFYKSTYEAIKQDYEKYIAAFRNTIAKAENKNAAITKAQKIVNLEIESFSAFCKECATEKPKFWEKLVK